MSKRASGKYAYGFSDRSGFRYPLKDLVEEYKQGIPTGLRVGRDEVDPDHPQNWLGRLNLTPDAQALEDARPDQGIDESRKLFSWNPVGVGNMEMRGEIGKVSFNTITLQPISVDAYGDVYDSYVASSGLTNYSFGHNQNRYAQSWQSDSSPRDIIAAAVRLRRLGDPTGTILLRLKGHSGTYGTSSVPSETVHAVSESHDVSNVATGLDGFFYYFVFDEPWAPSASTPYTLEVDGTGVSGDASNYVAVRVHAVSPSHGGNGANDSSGSYVARSGEDMLFYLYESPA